MLKKVDYKLINICLVVLSVYLIYQSSGLWINILSWIKKICYPIFISFFLAYAFYPVIRFLEMKKISKRLSIIIIILCLILIFIIFIFLLFPLLFNDLGVLFSQIITFLEHLARSYNFNINNIEDVLINSFNTILNNLSMFSSIISKTLNFLGIIVISFSFFIYFLSYMDEIRKVLKKKIPKRIYNLVINIDEELKKYFISFIKIMFITLFEYGISLFIIGHPSYLLLGILASFASLIPYFGGIIVNMISLVTSFVISKTLFIKTIVLIVILSFLDSYVIGPMVYGKSNRVHPLITLLGFFIFEKIFGIMGIIISMPVTIILLTIYRFIKEEKYDTKT